MRGRFRAAKSNVRFARQKLPFHNLTTPNPAAALSQLNFLINRTPLLLNFLSVPRMDDGTPHRVKGGARPTNPQTPTLARQYAA
jgi:hypothetical protein